MDCIVNVTQNWGIGRDGDLLVSIPTDLRRFRALTTGKTVVYGRKTLLTFPHARPLPNRENWILSATPGFSVPGAAVFPSLAALQEAMRTRPADSLCLIGGASVYRALLPWCSRVLLTQTCADLPADRFFPDLDRLPNWRCTDTGPLQEDGGHCFRYLTYENDAPLPFYTSLSKKSLWTFSPSCFQNCKIKFCSIILQFCRRGGLLNVKGHPDGFLSHFSSLRNFQLGKFFDSLPL